MKLIPARSWLDALTRRGGSAARRGPDFADMGTAFGLDASMMDDDAADTVIAPADPEAPAPGSAQAYAEQLHKRVLR